MQPLGNVPGFVLGRAAGLGGGREAIDEGRDVLGGGGRRQRRGGGHLPVVDFLDDLGPDELVAMARNGANEPRLAGIVAERPPERPDSLGQRSVGNDDVAPDLFEDGLLGHRVAPANDEQLQQIEVFGINATGVPFRNSSRWRGESTNSANRNRTGGATRRRVYPRNSAASGAGRARQGPL